MARLAYCVDCEWQGEALGANPRKCPSCGGNRVVIKSINALVAAVAATPQDDGTREQVIHDLRSDAEALARWAGAIS